MYFLGLHHSTISTNQSQNKDQGSNSHGLYRIDIERPRKCQVFSITIFALIKLPQLNALIKNKVSIVGRFCELCTPRNARKLGISVTTAYWDGSKRCLHRITPIGADVMEMHRLIEVLRGCDSGWLELNAVWRIPLSLIVADFSTLRSCHRVFS
jgi:hypothetical protein